MRPIIRVAVIGLVGSLAFAGESKVSSDMPHSTAPGTVDVIVQYKSFAAGRTVEAGGLGQHSSPFSKHPGNPYDRAGFDDSKPGIEPAGGLHLAEPEDRMVFLDITTQTVNANTVCGMKAGTEQASVSR